MSEIHEMFQSMRFEEKTHLGMGDIRLTISDQNKILSEIDALKAKNEALTSAVVELRDALRSLAEWEHGEYCESLCQKYDHIGRNG